MSNATNAPVKFAGFPDGPKQFVPEMGCETGTFTTPPGGDKPALNYHVPLKMRGPFRPDELANFDPKTTYRTNTLGYLLCYGSTRAGEKCSRKAENRSWRCNLHGGRLHPLDKLVKDDQEAANRSEAQALSRYKQFQAGQITVDDLDDEELATCGFKSTNGRIYKPRNVPREMVTAFQKAIYERAQLELRSLAVDAARTVGEIMKNRTVEPDIRLKAAITALERTLGKTPQVVALTDATGFEEVFDGIISTSRERSRAARDIVDAEVVDTEPGDSSQADDERDAITGNVEPATEQPSKSLVTQRDSGLESTDMRDPRLFERNEAILAQTIEVKPFEYNLSDNREAIKKATQKRYASKALGVDLTAPAVPLIRVEENGLVRHVDPNKLKVKAPQSNSAAKARKRYTLEDF